MIIVTGADGIVGRAVCNALTKLQKSVLPVIRQKRTFTAANAYIADLSLAGALDALRDYPIEAIVHLAAAVPHSMTYPDTQRSADVTRRMDRNVKAFAESSDVPVVYMSTCGLYDRSSEEVKYEDNALQIRIESPYFSAKLDGESLFEACRKATIIRLAAPIGPGLKPGIVLSRFIMAARANVPIQIWGSGSREQNFIDARDVADIVLKVLADPRPCTLNVAGESPVTMVGLAKAVIGAVGGTFVFSGKADPREGETARYSIAKARELYGWSPVYNLEASCGLLLKEDFEGNT